MIKELIERLDVYSEESKAFVYFQIRHDEYAELRRLAVIGQQCLDAEPVAYLHNGSDNDDREFQCVDFEQTHPMSVHQGDKPLIPKPTK